MKKINIKKVIEDIEMQSLLVTKGFGYIHISDVIKIIKKHIQES